MRIDLGQDEEPEIGLIALIDCIFFLLMFFMVATSFKNQAAGQPQKALPIHVPQSEVSLDRQVATPDTLVIGVDAKGGVYWRDDPVSTEVLRERLHAQALRDPGATVRIDGDAQAAYQEIMHVVDLCQFEGLTKIALRARAGR
jgi:biopolymer transport protein ExbD